MGTQNQDPGKQQSGGKDTRTAQQQGEREPDQVANDDGISDDDIDEAKDAGSLGNLGKQDRSGKS